MKKFLYFMTAVFATFMLVACNTTEDTTKEPKNEKVTTSSTPVEEENKSETITEDEKTTASDQNTVEVKEEKVSEDERIITYTSNGEKKEATTKTVESNNQNFEMEVIPGFTLVAEEPGKDVLLYDNDENVSMRIETISLADTSYSDMLEATKEYMNASSSTGESSAYADAIAFAPTDSKNVAAFQNDFGEDRVIALLFETDKQIVRLTVFDKKSLDLAEAMLKMGATVITK